MESKEPLENRPEPRVEVDADLEEFEDRRGPDWSSRPVPGKKPITRWVLGPILVAALAALGYAFWLIWGMKPIYPGQALRTIGNRGFERGDPEIGRGFERIKKGIGRPPGRAKDNGREGGRPAGSLGHICPKKWNRFRLKRLKRLQEKKPARKTLVYKIQPGTPSPPWPENSGWSRRIFGAGTTCLPKQGCRSANC